jgi:hypothetical protein
VLWRRPGQQAIAATASLRLSLAPREGRLAVRVLKRRGGDLAQPAIIDVDAALPQRLPRRPDPRTSAGHALALASVDATAGLVAGASVATAAKMQAPHRGAGN